jgi:Fur family ferric uptake transcriptional regulator
MQNQEIENKLRTQDVKPTAMRILVLRTLLNSRSAMSLSDIEQQFDQADRTTLYRTLKTFESKKIIHKIDDGTNAPKFAVCVEGCECNPEDLHIHFHCTNCEETYCLNNISIPTIELPNQFTLNQINMVVKGLCDDCSQ